MLDRRACKAAAIVGIVRRLGAVMVRVFLYENDFLLRARIRTKLPVAVGCSRVRIGYRHAGQARQGRTAREGRQPILTEQLDHIPSWGRKTATLRAIYDR